MIQSTVSRRKLLGGLAALIAAPAIIRVADLMPVKAIQNTIPAGSWFSYDGDNWHDVVANNARLTVPKGVSRVRVTGVIRNRPIQTPIVQVSAGDYFELFMPSEHSVEIRRNGCPITTGDWFAITESKRAT